MKFRDPKENICDVHTFFVFVLIFEIAFSNILTQFMILTNLHRKINLSTVGQPNPSFPSSYYIINLEKFLSVQIFFVSVSKVFLSLLSVHSPLISMFF